MDLEELQCKLCSRMYSPNGEFVPRLLPENGYTYCTACVQEMIDKSAGQETFFCPEDEETPCARKEKAEEYPKNFALLRMAEKYKKQQQQVASAPVTPVVQEEQKAVIAPAAPAKSFAASKAATAQPVTNPVAQQPQQIVQAQQEEGPQGDLCPIHGRKIEIICIDCKERICSSCALFGVHRQHDLRMEQDVLEEINIRTECLMEMYEHLDQAAKDKPDEAQVNQIYDQFKKKSADLRTNLKEKFKQMRQILIVQEQTTEAVLKKNLNHIENELKNLKSIDYKQFNDADRWLKNSKVKLDNFRENQNNPNYIAFDMLENVKTTQTDDFMNADNLEENLLDDDAVNTGKQQDVITQGEKLAETLGKVKTINPSLLASQLAQLSLTFDESAIAALNTASKCNAIEGVQVSQEELDAVKEAANAQADASDFNNDNQQMDMIEKEMAKMNVNEKKVQPVSNINKVASPIIPGGSLVTSQGSGSFTGAQRPVAMMNQKQPDPFTNSMANSMNESNLLDNMNNKIGEPQDMLTAGGLTTGGAEMDGTMVDGDGEELDPEFLTEIETYLKECMENNELSIDMSDTLIKDHGAKMVAAAASLCDQLQELRLQQCGITDDGAMELFQELRDLAHLQVIDLSFNPITEKSLDKLTSLLTTNQNLVVNMRMNSIKNKFAARKMQHFEQQGRLNITNQ